MTGSFRCTVVEIVNHGERIYSLFLKPERRAPAFLPGQFLRLALDEAVGEFLPETRSFSIASSPNERQMLRITYVVKGKFTSRMEAELHAGSRVWVRMPYGSFIVQRDGDTCLLAGGTGITAFTAFLAGLPPDHPHPIYLFYGARNPSLLTYRPQVEQAAGCCPSLHPFFFSEQAVAGMDCLPGRVDAAAIWKYLPQPLSLPFYMAGPPQMLDGLLGELLQRGVPAANIFKDAW